VNDRANEESPQAAPAAPVPVADGVDHPLDARYLEYGRAVAVIMTLTVALPVLLAAGLIAAFADLPGFVRLILGVGVPALVIVFGALMFIWPAKEHRHASYRLDSEGLHVRGGVFWRRRIHVPRSRIQHTDVSQGPVERHFGLATLHVFTAGTEHAEVKVQGLSHARAVSIRDYLIGDAQHDGV